MKRLSVFLILVAGWCCSPAVAQDAKRDIDKLQVQIINLEHKDGGRLVTIIRKQDMGTIVTVKLASTLDESYIWKVAKTDSAIMPFVSYFSSAAARRRDSETGLRKWDNFVFEVRAVGACELNLIYVPEKGGKTADSVQYKFDIRD